MRRYLLCLLSLLWLNAHAMAADSLTLLRHIPRQVRFFTSDPLGNTYLVLNDQSVLRLNAQGDSIGFFNQIQKGVLTHIDATNPLRVLLFYGQYGYVAILDNQTSLKSSFSLPRLSIFNAPLIANSADAQIWTYDPGTGDLLKVDDEPKIRFKTGLRNVFDETVNPCFMVEQDRRFFLVDSTRGVYVFDQYGLFKVKYPIRTKAIQFFNDFLVYYKAPYLMSYHVRSFKEQQLEIPDADNVLQVRLERNKLFVLRNNGLSIYQWQSELE